MTTEALMRWLEAGGLEHAGLVVREAPAGRGVFAARPLAAGSVVARIPRPLLITREVAKASSIARQLRGLNVELSGTHAVLAAWLLVEDRDPHAPDRAYLDVLPRDLTSFPVYAPPEERALLAGSLTGEMLRELGETIDDDLAKLGRTRIGRGIDRAALTWARMCVGSRVFSVRIDGLDTYALVPFADLLNHRRDEAITWGYDQAGEAFTLTARRDLAEGEEAYDSYGRKPNSRFLVQYGFCLDDNDDDQAELRFPASHIVTRDPTDGCSREMLAWLRQRHPEPAAARAVLARAVDAAVARFGSTIADDDALLAGGTLTPRARDFVRVRRGEKQVLAWWQDATNVTRAFDVAGGSPTPAPAP